jgi:hypothetical protein
MSGNNRFWRGISSAYGIDLSGDSCDWLAMWPGLLQTWGYGGKRFLRAKWEASDCCIDFLIFLQCYDLDFGVQNWFVNI